MAWRWLGDKPLSGPTSDNYWYHFTNSNLLYIWCPRVDATSLITWRPPHSKGNHSPHGLYTHLSEIHNFGVKFLKEQGSVNLSGRLRPEATPISGISSLVRHHLYIEPCPNNQTFWIQFNVFCCQQCYINHYNTPPEGCRHMTPFRMQHRNAITWIVSAPDLQQQTPHTYSTQMRKEMYSNTTFAQGQKQLSGCNAYR